MTNVLRYLLLVFLVFAWAHALNAVVKSETFWKALGGRLNTQEVFLAQHALFSHDSKHKAEVAIIGDSEFVQDVERILGASGHPLKLVVPRVDLRDVLEVTRSLNSLEPGKLIIQNRIHYWTNIGHEGSRTGPLPDLRLWNYHQSSESSFWPMKGVRLFFRTVSQATGCDTRGQVLDTWRETVIGPLHFRKDLPVHRSMKQELKKWDLEAVFWVEEFSNILVVKNPQLIRQIRAHLDTLKENKEYGVFLDRNSLAEKLQRN